MTYTAFVSKGHSLVESIAGRKTIHRGKVHWEMRFPTNYATILVVKDAAWWHVSVVLTSTRAFRSE